MVSYAGVTARAFVATLVYVDQFHAVGVVDFHAVFAQSDSQTHPNPGLWDGIETFVDLEMAIR